MRLVIISITLSLLIIAVGFYILPFRGEEFDIRKFNGDVVSVEGETVTLNGVFDGPAGTIPQDLLLNERDFSFKIDDSTQFTKADIGWPSWDKVDAAGGSLVFNIASLSYTEGPGSLGDLRSLGEFNPGVVYVEAEFQSSIYRATTPVASRVLYKLMSMPAPTPSVPTP